MANSDVLQKIRGTFDNSEFSDCTIHVEGKIFYINKLILTSQSEVFRAFFRHDSVEKTSDIIKIEESTPHLVKTMLRFMYGEKLKNLDADAYPLFMLADRYNVVELKNLCVQSMCRNLKTDTIFNCLSVAYRVNDAEFKLNCLDYAAKYEGQLRKQPEWIQLTNSEPQIARDLCWRLSLNLKRTERNLQQVQKIQQAQKNKHRRLVPVYRRHKSKESTKSNKVGDGFQCHCCKQCKPRSSIGANALKVAGNVFSLAKFLGALVL